MKDFGSAVDPVPDEVRDPLSPMDSGEKRLNELGYKQELKRDLNTFKMFAITLSTMTLFTGIVPYYSQALLNAGPVGITWGWWIAVIFVTFIGLALSEICSSFPTTGSLYYWAANLAGPKYGPFASWMTGYLEFIGIAIGVGSQSFAGCQVLQILILITTGGANGGGYAVTKTQFLGMMIATIFVCGLLNSCAVNLVALIDVVSAWWQIIGGIVLVITLPCVAPTLQSSSYVFTHFEDNLDSSGLPNGAYAFLVALLMSQYSLYGFDAAAHLTEETKGADKTGPVAILGSIGFFSIFGYCLLLSLTFSIQDPARLFAADTVTGGAYPVAQILWDAFYFRYGSGTGGVVFLVMIYGSFFFGCLSNLMSAARVCYALSRDGGLPLSFLWRRLSPRKVPIFAVWLCALIGVIVVLPVLASNVVFFAVTSMSTVGWVGSYSVPIFFRIMNPEVSFTPGPFYMGKYIGTLGGKLVHVVALLWILYTCVIFQLPLTYPVTTSTFNYAPVGMFVVILFFLSWWAIDARRWFKGPVRTVQVVAGEGQYQGRYVEGPEFVEERKASTIVSHL